MFKGHISIQDYATGILQHGEVDSLPFGIPADNRGEFSIFLQKADEEAEDVKTVILDVQLLLDAEASAYPVPVGQWTERNLIHIPATVDNQTVLANYRLFWRSGPMAPTV